MLVDQARFYLGRLGPHVMAKAKRKTHNGETRGVQVNGVFYEGLKQDSRGIYVYDPSLPRGKNIIRFGKPDTPEKARKVEARIIQWQRRQAERRGDVFHDGTIGVRVKRVHAREAGDADRQVIEVFGVGELDDVPPEQRRRSKAISNRQLPDGTYLGVSEIRQLTQEEYDATTDLTKAVPIAEFWKHVGSYIRRDPRTWAKRLGLPELKDLPYVTVQPDVSLDTIRDRYLNRVPRLSNTEQQGVKRAWKVFARAVSVATIADVDDEAIRRFAQEIDRRIQSRQWTSWKSTVSKALVRIRSVLRESADEANPADHCQRVLGMLSNKKLKASALETECAKRGQRSKAKRLIKPEEFQALFKAAKGDRFLTCAVLLGANCGWTQMSLIGCWRESLHLSDKPPYHDFHRVKRKVVKRTAPLWPETVKALKGYLTHDHDPGVTNGADKAFVFSQNRQLLTAHGLQKQLGGLVERAGIAPFLWSWWRHTCETVPRDEAPKQGVAIDPYHLNMVMGHVLPPVKQHYYLEGADGDDTVEPEAGS
jgi:hypothetical protein